MFKCAGNCLFLSHVLCMLLPVFASSPQSGPAEFDFKDQLDVPCAEYVYSEVLTLTGISGSLVIHVGQGEYSLNGSAYTSAIGTVANNAQLRLRQLSSSSYGQVTVAIVTVGSYSDRFCARTLDNPSEGWSQAPGILAGIVAPVFPNHDFVVTDYGAVGNGTTLCTQAFANTIQACHAAGGGRVLVPSGVYLCGAIRLLSNVNLHLADDAIISFSQNPADFPVVYTRFEGTECMNYSPLIYAFEQENIAVTGAGTLNGRADATHWWPWGDQSTDDKLLLYSMADNNLPVEQRIFGAGHFLRPSMIQPYRCRNFLLQDVRILNGPMWHVHPVLCTNIIIDGITVSGAGPNNDGCNPESCDNVWIKNCTFNTGDDCIALKSGRDSDGRRINVPIKNVVVQDCIMQDGHGGVTIGSEMSGGVRNIFAERCTMSSPHLKRALRIKTNSERGGVIEHIYYRHITIGQVSEAAVIFDFYYGDDTGDFTPILHNVELEDVNLTKSGRYGLFLRGFQRSPIQDIRLVNCNFAQYTGNSYSNVQNLILNNTCLQGDCHRAVWYALSEEQQSVLLQVKAFLEGPYQAETNTMITGSNFNQSLRQQTTSPYWEDPVQIADMPANAVDWMLIRIYSVDWQRIVRNKSVILLNTGELFDPVAGSTQIRIYGVPLGSYYVALYHRNHIGVVSSLPLSLISGSAGVWDFAQAADRYWGGNSGAKLLRFTPTSVWGLCAGDIDADGALTTQDYVMWYGQFFTAQNGYLASDLNMDGQVNALDCNLWWINACQGTRCQLP